MQTHYNSYGYENQPYAYEDQPMRYAQHPGPYEQPPMNYEEPLQGSYQERPTRYAQEEPLTKVPTNRETNRNVTYSIENGTKAGMKAVVLRNVDAPYMLDVKSDNIAFHKTKSTSDGTVKFNFIPNGNQGKVSILNDGLQLRSFNLTPQLPKVKFFKSGQKIRIKNMYSKKGFELKANAPFTYKLTKDESKPGKHNYVLSFNAYGNIVNVQMRHYGKMLTNGNLRLAPRNRPVAPRTYASRPVAQRRPMAPRPVAQRRPMAPGPVAQRRPMAPGPVAQRRPMAPAPVAYRSPETYYAPQQYSQNSYYPPPSYQNQYYDDRRSEMTRRG